MKKPFIFRVLILSFGLVAMPCLGVADELIINGNFESTVGGGIPNWVTGATPSSFSPSQHSGIVQHDASVGVVVVAPGNSLGGYNNSWVRQQVHIPRDAVGSTLTFYYDWYISYKFGTQLYMTANFGGQEMAREQGNGLLTQPTPTPGWTRVDYYLDLPSYSDQDVQVLFQAFDDGISDANYVFFDDVSLNVITATITPTPTYTITPTVSQTATISPTNTITPTITETATITPTISPTPTTTPWAVPGGDVIVFPNPAAGDSVTFMYSLGEPSDVDIDVYNLLGYKVAHLEDKNKAALINRRTTWSIKDLAPGVYLYQVTIRSQSGQVQKNKIRRLVITK